MTHRPPYTNDDERTAMGDALGPFDAVLAGHIHFFAALNVAALPPLLVNGEGGANLDPNYAAFLALAVGDLHVQGDVFGAARFGFGVYTRAGAGLGDLAARRPRRRVRSLHAREPHRSLPLGRYQMIVAAVLSAWVQYAADGKAHVRALAPQSCPAAVTYDGGTVRMRLRAGTAPGFDEVVCDAAIPDTATNVKLENLRLPSPAGGPQKIVVLGDTGCRMSAWEQQNCGDIADWPFPRIARAIAKVHPGLIVHVGDYYYRETNCVANAKDCVNRWGDTSLSWNADWFWPAQPLFSSAPLVLIRGNHEDCERGGPAWFRYLDGGDAVTARVPPAPSTARRRGRHRSAPCASW